MLTNQPLSSVGPKTVHQTSGRRDFSGVEVEERLLWTRFRDGDEEAFASIYDRYVVSLYHYGERLCADHTLIEDSIHDLFVDLSRHRKTAPELSSLKFYLFKGFKNRLIKNIQKKNKLAHARIDDGFEFEMVFSFESELIAAQISEEQRIMLYRAIDRLSPRQKEALTLRFFDALSYPEIASLMTLPVKSVYMLIYRAIDWLKHNLKIDSCFLFTLWLVSGLVSLLCR